MRDWRRWHEDYQDPSSDLSHRLAEVRRQIRLWLDQAPPGPQRVLSLCAGQGDDLVGALVDHDRRDDATGTLIELDAENVSVANDMIVAAAIPSLRAVVADAGCTDAYTGAVPADLILACGVFGNVSDQDVESTITAMSTFCAPGATVIWTRHRRTPDLTPQIKSWFGGAGFQQIAFVSPGPERYSVGVHRLVSTPRPFQAGTRLFEFVH